MVASAAVLNALVRKWVCSSKSGGVPYPTCSSSTLVKLAQFACLVFQRVGGCGGIGIRGVLIVHIIA